MTTFRRFRDEGADFPRFSTFPALSGGVLISGNAPMGARNPARGFPAGK